jgi:glucose/arabinose dehydrogenase
MLTRKQHLRNAIIIVIIALIGLYWYLSTPDKARQPIEDLQGTVPAFKEMRSEKFPTIKTPEIVGWQGAAKPVPAKGLAVTAFADKLDHPRWLLSLPNGDVLVAEATQPNLPAEGVMDWLAKKMIKDANGTSVSANRITLLRDADGDGVAEFRSALIAKGLNSPFGMAFKDGQLYIANTDSVVRFAFTPGQTSIAGDAEKLLDLPANAPNNHWTRTLLIKGDNLYVTIGSNSNIAENGQKAEKGRAQITEFNLKTKEERVYAYGIRNAVGLAVDPFANRLWMTVNERDMLGSDGPPDYLSSVDFGTFYGWPWYYWGRFEDMRVVQNKPSLRQYSKPPNYGLGPHVAALGLAFNKGPALGEAFKSGAIAALHGSWNRVPVSGYKVVYIPFNDKGFPVEGAKPVDLLTGFLNEKGDAQGRPAGLTFDSKGGLLVADDAGNRIWRVTAAPAAN